MKNSVENSVKELIAKAKKEAKKTKASSSRSSLHSLMKTRQQATRFMQLLKAVEGCGRSAIIPEMLYLL
jgi:gamma-glutamyl:cysteine ligase YbdK (ATP-grasp superfamily)